MTQNITLDDFYALFRESERQRQETERLLRQSLEDSRREFERDLAESRAKFERDLAESSAEFDRRFAKTERIAAQANEAVNNLTSRWGRFVENLVAPAALRLFQERGILVNRVYQRMKAPRGRKNLEIDVFAVNHEEAVVIEVKSRLTQEHVRKLLETLEDFKTVFREYVNHRIYGAIAAIEIDGDVDTYAENQGLFILEQSGDSVHISTADNFTPRTW